MTGVHAPPSVAPSSDRPPHDEECASISGMVEIQAVTSTQTMQEHVCEEENLVVKSRTINISKVTIGGASSSIARSSLRQRSSKALATSRNKERSSVTVERKRSHVSNNHEERTGFARIYFENQNFTSSTVLKLTSATTVIDLRKSMALKMKISASDFIFYVIVVVYPSENGQKHIHVLK